MGIDGCYIESWTRRVVANAPKNETTGEILAKMKSDKYINRGRFAAYVVRLAEARKREGNGTLSITGGDRL